MDVHLGLYIIVVESLPGNTQVELCLMTWRLLSWYLLMLVPEFPTSGALYNPMAPSLPPLFPAHSTFVLQ